MKYACFFSVISIGLTSATIAVAQVKITTGSTGTGKSNTIGNTTGSTTQNNATAATTENNVSASTTPSISQRPWFENSALRTELRMTPEQYRQLSGNYAAGWQQYSQEMARLNPNLAAQLRAQRVDALSQRFNSTFNQSLNQVYTDRTARRRYDQLYRQYQGYNAFSDPAVVQQLNLTPQQRQQFNRYHQQWNQSLTDFQNRFAEDRLGATSQFNNALRERQQQIEQTLTPAQRQAWSSYTGDPYNFSPDVYFPANQPATAAPVDATTISPQPQLQQPISPQP